MCKHSKLSKSLADEGWELFLRALKYKRDGEMQAGMLLMGQACRLTADDLNP